MTTSTPSNRSAARLVLLVAQERVETNPSYVRRDVTGDGILETWCNLFAANVSARMGAPLPLGKRANELHAWLVAQAAARASGVVVGWEKTDAHTAQAMADQGCLAIAAWANPMRNADGSPQSGHIAILMPSLGESGVWCAQAGKLNFTRELLQRGFGAISPDMFVHP